MTVRVCYPKPNGERVLIHRVSRVLRWPFLLAAYLCPILNLVEGGKAWSVVVLWSLWMVWTLALSPALVEMNRLSITIKLIANVCILLVLIDLFLAPGWAVEVVPIVCFSGLVTAGTLFFTDARRQRQNMAPMLLLLAVSVPISAAGLVIWWGESSWAMAVMGALALALLAACAMVLGPELLRGIRKYFHTR